MFLSPIQGREQLLSINCFDSHSDFFQTFLIYSNSLFIPIPTKSLNLNIIDPIPFEVKVLSKDSSTEPRKSA